LQRGRQPSFYLSTIFFRKNIEDKKIM